MVERSATRHPVERGLPSRVLGYLMFAPLFLMVSLVFSIAVEWIGMTWWWPEQGRRHSARLLENELRFLNQDFARSALVERPVRFAQSTADWLQQTLYRKTGIERAFRWLASPQPNPSGLRPYLKNGFSVTTDYLFAAMTITQVFAVRLAVLVLALPAFALGGLVGFTDGLVQRDLRRWGGGRESSFVYHWAKRFVVPALFLPWPIYLSLPFSLHPNAVVLPFAVVFAVALAVLAASFKKYL